MHPSRFQLLSSVAFLGALRDHDLLMSLFIICLLPFIERFESNTSDFLALFWGGGLVVVFLCVCSFVF